MRRRALALVVTLGLACGGDGSGPGGGPPPGNYTTLIADDWQSYANTQALLAASGWVQSGTHACCAIDTNTVHLVSDPTFGQVARITQPFDADTTETEGWTVQYYHDLPAPRDKVWLRFRAKFSPGWTTASPYPAGAANSYKLVFMFWVALGSRVEIEFSNTNQYTLLFSFAGLTCNNVIMPNSPTSFGFVSTEWTDNEWYEYIMYYEKTGTNSAQHRWWRRQLTQGGAIVNNAFTWFGTTRQSCSGPTPQIRAIQLGGNKNKVTRATQTISWGPWEVVDGSQYPDPFGVGP